MTTYEIAITAAAKEGDSEAFEALYGLYHKKVYALARATVRSESDAEDILQQTFINAWRNLNSLNDPAAFNTWIQRITLNLCNSLLRKKNITIIQDIDDDDIYDYNDVESDELLPSLYAERDDLKERLSKIIDGLSEFQKQTLLLYYYDELKVEEIAQLMNCNVGTVKSRLHLARKSVRTEIEESEKATGQKFYGIAGIATIGFGQLLVRQLEEQALSCDVFSSAYNGISQTLGFGTAPAPHTSIVNRTVNPVKNDVKYSETAISEPIGRTVTATRTKARLSIPSKVFISILSAVLIIGGGYLVYKSIADNPEQPNYIEDGAASSTISTPDNDIPTAILTPDTSDEDNTAGNTNGNIANNGLAAIQGEWIYYRNYGDDGCIIRMKADGSDRHKINDDYSYYINVLESRIYYLCADGENSYIYSISTDGTDRRRLNDDSSRYVNVVGDRIYYSNWSDNKSIYSMSIDGTDRQKLNNDESWNISIEGDRVYYNNESDGWSIYSIKVDGSDRQKLNDVDSRDIIVVSDRIFYINGDDNWTIYSMKTDGTDVQKLNYEPSWPINEADGWIFYSNASDNGSLYKIKTDGSDKQKVCDDYVRQINIVGNRVFYISYNDDDYDILYSIKTDGTDRRKESPLESQDSS